MGDYNLNFEKRSPHGWTTLKGLQEQDLSVINSFTQHTINLTRKALRLGSDFVHPVHDDTPDEPDYLSNADVRSRLISLCLTATIGTTAT